MSDQPLPEDEAIRAAHPMQVGGYDIYAEAMRLVGAKQSKGALVDLVNWLLRRIPPTTPDATAADQAAWCRAEQQKRDQERWIRYAREVARANLHTACFADDALRLEAMTRIQAPTVTMMREDLVRFRADYYALLILAAELLGKDPRELTVGDAFFAMVARYTPPRDEEDRS